MSALRLLSALAAATLVAAAPAVAQAGPQDENYVRMANYRTPGLPVVHLFGDSIMRGYAHRKFPDQYSPEEVESEILWPLRSPASMLKFIAEDDYWAGYAGGTGLPYTTDPKGNTVYARVDNGQVFDDDFIVISDAGEHNNNPAEYYLMLRSLRTLLCAYDVDVLYVNTYDDIAPGALAIENEDQYRWSVPIDGVTMNSTFEKAANEEIADCKADAHLIDIVPDMIALKERGLSPIQPDGIHPNITGQWLIAFKIDSKVREIMEARAGAGAGDEILAGLETSAEH